MSLQDLLLGNQYLAHQAALAAAAAAAAATSSGASGSSNKTASNAHQQQATFQQQNHHQDPDHSLTGGGDSSTFSQLTQQTTTKHLNNQSPIIKSIDSDVAQYQQALAAALMSMGASSSPLNTHSLHLATSVANASYGAQHQTTANSQLLKQHNHHHHHHHHPNLIPNQQAINLKDSVKQQIDIQMRQQQQQQNLLALLVNLTSNAVSLSTIAPQNNNNHHQHQKQPSPITISPSINNEYQQAKCSPHNLTTTNNNSSPVVCNQQQQQQQQQQQLIAALMQQQLLQQQQSDVSDMMSNTTASFNRQTTPDDTCLAPFQQQLYNSESTSNHASYSTLKNGSNSSGKTKGSRFNPMRVPQTHSATSKLKTAQSLQNLTNNNNNNNSSISAKFASSNPPPSISPQPPVSSSSAYWRLLESFFDMNDEPEEEALELIAQRTNSTSAEVANWFQSKREAERTSCIPSPIFPSPNIINHETTKSAPSSTLLAKLSAVTSRSNYNTLATKLDQKMVDLLESFYAINDNPEAAAIEMIAKRINTTVEAISDWFDKKRIKTNPLAGPRSPPARKREGGRVVTFSEYQRSLLEAIFDENNYLHPQEYEELSNLIQVPSRNIKIWFKNRRSKQRLSGRIATPSSVNNSD